VITASCNDRSLFLIINKCWYGLTIPTSVFKVACRCSLDPAPWEFSSALASVPP
jgi:hypothetical protein